MRLASNVKLQDHICLRLRSHYTLSFCDCFNCNCINRLTVSKPLCNSTAMKEPYSISPMDSSKASSPLPLLYFFLPFEFCFCQVCGELNQMKIKLNDFLPTKRLIRRNVNRKHQKMVNRCPH